MILGSGGIGIVLESEEGARRRYVAQQNMSFVNGHANGSVHHPVRTAPFCCRLLGTLISNSAYHGASMDKMHIAAEMERFIFSIEKEQLIPRSEIALHGVYFSHETSTHASPTSSCSYNEVSYLHAISYIILLLMIMRFVICSYMDYVKFSEITSSIY